MVIVSSLVENITKSNSFKAKHGLCLFIKTDKHKILFDLGPDETFYFNALKKGINLKEIDTVIISHGHNDHCGGLPYFLRINDSANIYIKKEAFKEHFNKGKLFFHNIGIDKYSIDKKRLIYVEDYLKIDDELQLFSNVTGRKLFSSMNDSLFSKEIGGRLQRDNFEHEQYLVVSEKDKDVLFTGCSHNGVVNIIEKYEEYNSEKHHKLLKVIGGFHLYNPVTKKYERQESVLDLAKWICSREENYVTCHCTGEKAYALLKNNSEGKITYLSCGEDIII